jgi:hypothetical protein
MDARHVPVKKNDELGIREAEMRFMRWAAVCKRKNKKKEKKGEEETKRNG